MSFKQSFAVLAGGSTLVVVQALAKGATMRMFALLILALILPGEVQAAPRNRIEVRGCVRTLGSRSACLIVNTNSDTTYFLSGRNLSFAGRPLDRSTVYRIRGRVVSSNRGYERCPTRLIIAGDIRVSNISPTRALCPRQ
jgi:hypothetical protein